MSEVIVNTVIIQIVIVILFALTPYFSRKEILFGVKIGNSDEAKKLRQQIIRKYLFSFIASSLVILLINAAFAAQYQGVISLLLPFEIILIFTIFFIYFYFKVKKIKLGMENGSSKIVAVADLSFRKKIKIISPFVFMIPFLIYIGIAFVGIYFYDLIPERFPVHYGINGMPDRYAQRSYFELFKLPAIGMAVTFLLLFSSQIFRVAKQELSPDAPKESAEANLRFRYLWSCYIAGLATFISILFALIFIKMTGFLNISAPIFAVIIIAFTIIMVGGAIALSIFTGQGGQRLMAIKEIIPGKTAKNDDNFWILGVFYYNKNDPAIFVEKRFGIGYTINMARPAGIVILIGIAIILPIIIIWISLS